MLKRYPDLKNSIWLPTKERIHCLKSIYTKSQQHKVNNLLNVVFFNSSQFQFECRIVVCQLLNLLINTHTTTKMQQVSSPVNLTRLIRICDWNYNSWVSFALNVNHFQGCMWRVSGIKFAKIHSLVSEISCLQNFIMQTDTQTGVRWKCMQWKMQRIIGITAGIGKCTE